LHVRRASGFVRRCECHRELMQIKQNFGTVVDTEVHTREAAAAAAASSSSTRPEAENF
jgi:hypothetical protein